MPTRRSGDAAISDEAVAARTGKGWKAWFALLDRWGASGKGHTETARHLREAHGLGPWWSQMVTVAYERERGLRVVGQRSRDFGVDVQRTVAVAPARAWAAFTDSKVLARWLGPGARVEPRVGGRLRAGSLGEGEIRALVPGERLRCAWSAPGIAPGSSVEVTFAPKGRSRVAVRVGHTLKAGSDCAPMKLRWTEAMEALRERLEDAPAGPPRARARRTEERT
jgi:uncharacterized protein YndB with AHSA1/START domain